MKNILNKENKLKNKEEIILINKVVKSIQRRGFRGSIKRFKEGPPLLDVCDFWDFIVDTKKVSFSREDYEKNKGDKILLNWVVPEIGKGSGGHLNIFRFISFLEKHKIHNKIYVFRSNNFSENESLRSFVKENFPILDNNVEVYYDTKFMEFAHGTIATGWTTAYFVRNFDNTISKFYFIQDFEPYFYPLGSEYSFAENTYRFGFRGITAGDWLKEKCTSEYNMIADSFSFSYDKDLYIPRKKTDSTKRIFFYARPVTPRRDFELGLLALNELAKRIPQIEVVFAGWDISRYKISFKHQNKGIVNINDLSNLYSSCDLCLIISSTNLSLLPLEVMSSGSVAVCSKGANSEWLVNEENSILVDFDPVQIAETMEYYLTHEDDLDLIRNKGVSFAKNTSWETEGYKVLNIILKGIYEDEKNIGNRG